MGGGLGENRHTTSPNSSSFWNTPKAICKGLQVEVGVAHERRLLTVAARMLSTT
jgi:hypothetical protein